jgi:hypothetical protein
VYMWNCTEARPSAARNVLVTVMRRWVAGATLESKGPKIQEFGPNVQGSPAPIKRT